jgi:hypothetical protein
MRRKSGANFDELLNKEWSILTKNEYSELQTAFKKTDQRNGGISFYDLINIIRSKATFRQIWAFLSPKTAKIRSTRTSTTKKSVSSTSPSSSTPQLLSRRNGTRITEEKSLRKTSTVSRGLCS